MNYIQEINRFYDWLEINSVPKSAIALWHALMHINNKANWVKEFTVAMSVLEFKTGFKRSELFEARNVLTQKKLIAWTARGGSLSASYKIKPFCVHNTDTKAYANGYANPTQTPTQTGTINKLKETKLEDNTPLPPKKGESEKTWKNDFEIYKSELKEEYNRMLSDKDWISQQEGFNPGVNIQKSLEKACANYWNTEAGWKKKKGARIKTIDWTGTFANALSLPSNKVYKEKQGYKHPSAKNTTEVEHVDF